MIQITFIDHKGNQRTVDAQIGDSLMEAAVQNNIDDIYADCGGACACATCHVYIDEKHLDKVDEADEIESEMLSVIDKRNDNSRLSCQIWLTEDHDGLVVTTPESQY